MEYSDYKGMFQGESLFVCGNAPSLAQYYPQLENMRTMTFNHISLWEDRPFCSTFYACTEPMHYGRWGVKQESGKGAEVCFALSVERPEPWPDNNWVWIPKSQGPMIQQTGITVDAPFPTGANSPMNIGIQFGAYMGFTDIYLVAIELLDHDKHVYEELPEDHPNYELRRSVSPYQVNRLVLGYNMAASSAKNLGVSVWNCTPHGAIFDESTIPYISFEEAKCRAI